ncbi:Alpha carbonic anhydrase 7 [Nymphaea thermarum]|nr:Alpha carbonic anhydrase 7 [Nymphaea thermarum]
MAMNSKFILLSVLFGVLLFACITSAQGEEVFEYEEGSPRGPQHWGELNFPNWTTCAQGMMQSPIDIESKDAIVAPELGPLKRNYKAARAILRNRRHDISV